jgi:protein-arginine kinase activator protein McsA
MTRNEGIPQALCLACADATFQRNIPGANVNLVDFWVSLANPRSVVDKRFEVTLPDDAACGACLLTFQEFATLGLAGCDSCYSAFEPVILPALAHLHNSS